MQVKKLATKDVLTVEPEDFIDQAIDLMEQHDIRHLPVLDAGRLVGIVSDRDILLSVGWLPLRQRQTYHRNGNHPIGPKRIKEIMTRRVISLSPTDPIATAAEIMVDRKIGAAPLINDQGRLSGLISETDILKAFHDEGSTGPGSKVRGYDRVRTHMRAAALTIAPDDPLNLAIRLFRENHIRHLPVLAGGDLVGILSDRDVRLAIGRADIDDQRFDDSNGYSPTQLTVGDAMCEQVVTIEADAMLLEAAEMMLAGKFSALPVLETGEFAGIITETDLLRVIAQSVPRP